MNRVIRLISTALLSVLLCTVFSAIAAPAADPHEDMIKRTVADLMKKNNIPGVAVALYVDGKPYSYYFGYANREKKIPVTKTTIFEIGSLSELMTGVLFAEEVDFNKMNLTDSVKKYVPDLPESFDKVTLQSLATYTAGLPGDAPRSIATRAELQDYLSKWNAAAPGEEWSHSGLGIGMLGYALESSTQKDLDWLYRHHIAWPLNMRFIGINVPDKFKSDAAQGYNIAGHPVTEAQTDLYPAARGVKTSGADLQQFLGAAIGLPGTSERVLYPMRMTQSAYVKLPNEMQGLVWNIHPRLTLNDVSHSGPVDVEEVFERPTFNLDALLDKTGTTQGFHSYMALIPNKKAGIVILTNKSMSDDELVKVGRRILFSIARESKTTA